MGTLYLIRHGVPNQSLIRGPRCVGRTELSLSREGRFQAALAGAFLPKPELVCSSPLWRAVHTAQAAFGRVDRIVPALTELDMGKWDGLYFDEIKKRWPDLYQRRGDDPLHVLPPGGEAPLEALKRFRDAVEELADAADTVAVVAHAGVIRLLLCDLAGREKSTFLTLSQPCGCVNVLTGSSGGLTVVAEGVRPVSALTEETCLTLLKACGCDETLIAHCRKVAEVALRLAEGLGLNMGLLRAAALLHDVARNRPQHAKEGAAWLRRAGYDAVAAVVELHHDWVAGPLDEAAVLFLADKLVRGDQEVTIAERFGASAAKCMTVQAKEAHARRRAAAEALERRLMKGKNGRL